MAVLKQVLHAVQAARLPSLLSHRYRILLEYRHTSERFRAEAALLAVALESRGELCVASHLIVSSYLLPPIL